MNRESVHAEAEGHNMNIFLGILALIFAVGMIGDKEQGNRNNFTFAFVACVVAIVAINIIK
jgi:hypothetical protein